MTYGINADQLVVWIESLDGAVAHRAGVLCRRHADAMVVPLGWMLDDRRESVPRLFKTREAAPPLAPRPRRHRIHHHRDETGQLTLPAELDPPAVEAVHDIPTPAIAATSAIVVGATAETGDAEPSPWKPVFDQRDDLDGLLTARSPLLSRAFGKRDQPGGS
ncbi:MAG: hypothetical protein WCC60_15720 [Ilumatobacteraceae bacterium]